MKYLLVVILGLFLCVNVRFLLLESSYEIGIALRCAWKRHFNGIFIDLLFPSIIMFSRQEFMKFVECLGKSNDSLPWTAFRSRWWPRDQPKYSMFIIAKCRITENLLCENSPSTGHSLKFERWMKSAEDVWQTRSFDFCSVFFLYYLLCIINLVLCHENDHNRSLGFVGKNARQKDTWTNLRAKINLCAFQPFLSGIYRFSNQHLLFLWHNFPWNRKQIPPPVHSKKYMKKWIILNDEDVLHENRRNRHKNRISTFFLREFPVMKNC